MHMYLKDKNVLKVKFVLTKKHFLKLNHFSYKKVKFLTAEKVSRSHTAQFNWYFWLLGRPQPQMPRQAV